MGAGLRYKSLPVHFQESIALLQPISAKFIHQSQNRYKIGKENSKKHFLKRLQEKIHICFNSFDSKMQETDQI